MPALLSSTGGAADGAAGVAKAHSMGIRIAAGTDGGPGAIMNGMRELDGCGFSPMEAIVIATRDTADALGVLDQVGTIETGKRADLILVKGDPTKDISILTVQDSITFVMKDGKVARACSAAGA